MNEYLFTYGTLQPGCAPGEIAGTMAMLQRVATGRVRGVLYDFGDYPGAVLDAAAATEIEGTVWALSQKSDTLRHLDAYEEFDSNAPECSLFRRVLHPITLNSGKKLDCWIYVYNRDPAGAVEVSQTWGTEKSRGTCKGNS